jgi:3-dehydroquinate synthase
MREGNCVVALTAEPAELTRRLAQANGRPLLKPDPSTAVAELLPERLDRYLAADLVVATDGRSTAEVASRISGRLPRAGLLRIPIAIPAAHHEASVGSQLGGVVASFIQRMRSSLPIMLVTDSNLARTLGASLVEDLAAFGITPALHVVPAGERAKDIDVLSEIYRAMGDVGIDRDGLLIALGGGTVGDVAGFAAATWMRGIRYIHLPTTLLAMVDSSIGGKTAINLASGKNMVGAVHQPCTIVCDLDYLATLPEDDYRASLAEVIKAGVIADAGFVGWLSTNMGSLRRRDPPAVAQAVARSISIKAHVVARDPFEKGERAILNYGHTVAHALERAAGFGAIRHGEAVAWGMEVAALISVKSGSCPSQDALAQRQLLQSAGLLRRRPSASRDALLDGLRHDKKSRGGEPRWVILRGLGRVEYGRRVDEGIVTNALAEVLSV